MTNITKTIFALILLCTLANPVHAKCVDYYVNLTGQIQDGIGQPLPNAKIVLRPNIKFFRSEPVVTNEDGAFEMRFTYAPYSGLGIFGDRCNKKLKWVELEMENTETHGKFLVKHKFKEELDYQIVETEFINSNDKKKYMRSQRTANVNLGVIKTKF